ncbi:hypothetical protein HNQ93_001479 [Hymenobacter luteus]|uniref:STAS/SEC14 domain-containing protein n=2 Tax=Hymenobacter TaxID=89966 RepID=A0A7W9T042_9BACT|nr:MULTISPECIES: STAS/SEC14 domain-containing protein [Hymenobacter]MBB4601160.1 hypothetical protein [Hymenobacter latericoloratus]MBB6058633.1 hypothetical protein [Hymenobacter luteus]
MSSAPEVVSYENEAGSLYSLPAGYLHLVWQTGPPRPEKAMREVFEQALQLLQQTGYPRLLTDHRQLTTYGDDVVGWLLADWLPRVVPTRLLQRVALMGSSRLTVRLQADYLFREAGARYGLQSRCFGTGNMPEALTWLLSPP